MHQICVPEDDSSAGSWHWLVDAIASEIAAGAPYDPKILVARVAARLEPGFDPYFPMMFTDPD